MLLDQLYTFYSAIDKSLTNSPENFTHSTWIMSEPYVDLNDDGLHVEGDNGPLNRKLDYIFSSDPLSDGFTHIVPFHLSDHAPVSAILVMP